MREFKEPYYDGPDCVCCKQKEDAIREDERNQIVEKIDTQLLWKNLDDGFRGGLEWVRRQLTDPDADGV
jgi:hypothetical protein